MSLAVLGAGPCSPVPAVDYVARWGAVARWSMDGASGASETDSINGLVLGSTNTVGTAAGILGTSRQFNSASSRRLSKVDDATLSTGNIDFWVSVWVYLDSKTAQMRAVAKGTTSTSEWGISYDNGSDRFYFNIRATGGGTIKNVFANNHGSPALSTWTHLVGYHDNVNDLIGIAVNGGSWDTLATAGVVPADLAGQFAIGADPGASSFWDGRIDEVAFGKNPPTGIAAMRDEIRDRTYNAGVGRIWPWT